MAVVKDCAGGECGNCLWLLVGVVVLLLGFEVKNREQVLKFY